MSEIPTEAHKIRPGLEGNNAGRWWNPDGHEIKAAAETYVQELDILGRVVTVKSDPLLHPDKSIPPDMTARRYWRWGAAGNTGRANHGGGFRSFAG
jgi:hypothetical protein